MSQERPTDYYEVLQISSSAEPDTIHRVYRLLAQRFHPDNRETGDSDRFRILAEAYGVLSDPVRRAQYDVAYHQVRQERWKLVSAGAHAENDYEFEEIVRLTVLEALYTQRRVDPYNPGIYIMDLEGMIGRPREHLEFTVWYLIQKNLAQRTDDSRLTISADGVDYLERNYQVNIQRRRLHAHNEH